MDGITDFIVPPLVCLCVALAALAATRAWRAVSGRGGRAKGGSFWDSAVDSTRVVRWTE